MGVLVEPIVNITPFVAHERLFPAPHNACGTCAGAASGPDIIAKDCKMSDMLIPKIMRW